MTFKNYVQSKKKNISLSIIFGTIIVYLLGFTMVLPFLWMLSTSLKPLNEVFSYPIKWIPTHVNLSGYELLLNTPSIGVPLYIYFLNSVIVAIIVLVGTFFSCSMAAYAFAKIKFKGRDAIFILYLAGMMVPYLLLMLPTFLIFRYAGIIDHLSTQWILSLFGIPFGSTFGVFLLRQFFKSIPDELIEAAIIDGAGHISRYFNIMLPLSKAALATLLVFTFIGTWNNYEMPLLYLRSPKLFTIPMGLRYISNNEDNAHNFPAIMAAAIVSVIPVIIIFFSAQRYFVEGISVTGIKG